MAFAERRGQARPSALAGQRTSATQRDQAAGRSRARRAHADPPTGDRSTAVAPRGCERGARGAGVFQRRTGGERPFAPRSNRCVRGARGPFPQARQAPARAARRRRHRGARTNGLEAGRRRTRAGCVAVRALRVDSRQPTHRTGERPPGRCRDRGARAGRGRSGRGGGGAEGLDARPEAPRPGALHRRQSVTRERPRASRSRPATHRAALRRDYESARASSSASSVALSKRSSGERLVPRANQASTAGGRSLDTSLGFGIGCVAIAISRSVCDVAT